MIEKMPCLLVIDDNPSIAMALKILFSLHGIQIYSANSPEEGLSILNHPRDYPKIDLVIQDMNFSSDTTSGKEGELLYQQIREIFPDMPIILLTAWTHIESAVRLVKLGAADYLSKPWDDQKLVQTVQNLLELSEIQQQLHQRLLQEQASKKNLQENYDLVDYIWQDRKTEKVLEMACKVAKAQASVLITGPNGSGKEKIAQIIQANSSVKDAPFVVVNCGAIPADLLEAELFGAQAGAYTGASQSREGKFEAAHGGTLFLDEIGNLSLNGQMKLLRVLETGSFSRLGSNKEIHVKVRVLSATNANLLSMIKEGGFREDLYYRLNMIEIALPALKDRPDDILPLARAYLSQGKKLSSMAQEALLAYPWPGNVRELKNTIQRACLLANSETLEKIDLGLLATEKPNVSHQNKVAITREILEDTLIRCNGNISQTAQELGLSRQSVYRRIEKFDISKP